MQGLLEINRISRKAGDLAILEMAARIDRAATDDMLVMRIGGDEFALISGLYDDEEAKRLGEAVLQKNGTPIDFEGREIPLSLWSGIIKIPETLRYSDFFNDMHCAITKSKVCG